MIFGIGVDLVSIRRIERAIQRWGDGFVRRVFTPEEAAQCSARPHPASAFALRFAAKEAFSKALGLGMRKGLKWKDIEVRSEASGRPRLTLHGEASRICRRCGVGNLHLSLSDEGDYGVAMVVAERLMEGNGRRC